MGRIYTKDEADIGEYTIRLYYYYPEDLMKTITITLSVVPRNNAPVFTDKIDDYIAYQNELNVIQLPDYYDADDDTCYIYAFMEGDQPLPDFIDFKENRFFVFPLYFDVGEYKIQLRLSDSYSMSTSYEFILTVEEQQ